TPHGTDLAALCAAHHVPHVRASASELAELAVAPGRGLRVVEVPTERSGLRALHDQIRTAVATSVGPFVGGSA
ncbi:MAG: 2-succinyl-5-enolpyruvyl-6-hydroxy-3-cyclohexene-1-carboxylic-acid synthase, partial [Pseudonocardiaceae bacterium]